jgi:molybdenum cofactor cytidylyltransferase
LEAKRPIVVVVVVRAIVPAAGRGGRMGAAKQMLDVGGRPMLLGVVDALLNGGVAGVTIVASGEVAAELTTLPAGVAVVVNDDPASQMIDSVRIGLGADGQAGQEDVHVQGYLVCPCDVAGLSADDVRRCVTAFAESPGRIVVATHAGRRGHPMIFPASLVSVVCSMECDAGLNRLARNRPQLVREIACDSPATVANVNTRADYERLRERSG